MKTREVYDPFKDLDLSQSRLEDLPANVIGEVVIYPNATILGQAVKDIDVVVIGELKNYTPSLKYYENGEEKIDKISIESFCFAIEVKSHDASIVRRGTDWYVPYHQHLHNVTDQSNKQKTSLFSFYKNQIGVSPYVTSKGLRNQSLSRMQRLSGK
ncbi:hypothetical protein [Butyrivibrio sp. FCS014]|uniref:hypothetical protein n=1 Tax=Butyrivibrio sp. FCS014 TaxID=1408304 RepID=UPI0004644818|nr:hypothetical protein [Butyrivibrio sp. FCS014]